jgi:DNA polymerase III delta prime subunit
MLSIHKSIYKSLDYYHKSQNIPNILFHGASGSGKKTIVNTFIEKLYKLPESRKKYVLVVDCIITNGIKFIRDELKFFAQSQINPTDGITFKTIVLLNAGHLTMDAQSALRRCIEQYSSTTRFFIIVEDKTKLLKPVQSRFSEIFVPLPMVNNRQYNLYNYHKKNKIAYKNYTNKRYVWLNTHFKTNIITSENVLHTVNIMIDRGYSAFELDSYMKRKNTSNDSKYIIVSLLYEKFRRDIKSEKLMLLNYLNNYFLRSNEELENILIM